MAIQNQTKKWVFATLTSLILVSAGPIFSAQGAQLSAPLAGALQPGAPVTFADIIEQVSPAVVSINVITKENDRVRGRGDLDNVPEFFREWLERQAPGQNRPTPREGRSLGSGFLISENGHVVTNHHVIDKASEITVRFQDGREFTAELIGSDERTDLAVLKIEDDKKFVHVEFANDVKLRVGDWVVAVGNPFGLGGTATAGIVSATGREIGGSAYDFIQVDASINRGNSGGPTFDLYGNVVGVNSQILSPSGGNIGIGFAIPARVASKITRELIAKGSVTRGWLGVTLQPVDQDLADSQGLIEAKGAIVSEVVADSPADKSGFEDGDIILQLDGVEIEDARDLTRRVGELFVGHNAKFVVSRSGRKKTLRVKIGERANSTPQVPEPVVVIDQVNEFGLVLGTMNSADRDILNIDDDRGIVIKRVESGSQASRKGLRSGNAILSVSDADIRSLSDFDKAVELAKAKGLKAIRLLVRTPGGQIYIALRIDKK